MPRQVDNSVSRPKCERCGHILRRVPWNTKGDVLICDNVDCQLDHQPQGFMQEWYRDMDSVMHRRRVRERAEVMELGMRRL